MALRSCVIETGAAGVPAGGNPTRAGAVAAEGRAARSNEGATAGGAADKWAGVREGTQRPDDMPTAEVAVTPEAEGTIGRPWRPSRIERMDILSCADGLL